MEALGSATASISHCEFNRAWVENRPTLDFSLPVWISSQVFACHMSSVILTDIIQTVLETSECFLNKTNNNRHILATKTEEQAVYSGHLWAPFIQATQYCPCSHKKLMASALPCRLLKFLIFPTLHAVGVGDGEFRCCMAVVLAGLGFHGLILPVLHLQMMTLHQTELALLLSELHKADVPSLYRLAIGFRNRSWHLCSSPCSHYA